MVSVRDRGRRNSQRGQGSSSSQRRQVRYRDRDIESFSGNTEVKLEHAYFDRVKLKIPAYRLCFSSISEYRSFRQHLINTRLIIQDRGGFKPAFRRGYLFSGNIDLQLRDIVETGQKEVIVRYDLNVNPSRFIHHAFIKCNRDPEQFTLSALREYALRDGGLRELLIKEVTADKELSLDRQDNFIPKAIFKISRPFDDFVELYIRSVVNLLNEQIRSSYELAIGEDDIESDNCILSHHGWEVSACEVYWEYGTHKAIDFVNGLWEQFQNVLYDTSRKRFSSSSTEERRIYNGVAIYANDFGVDGLKLIAYAKLNRRVRFEIRYNRTLKRLLASRETQRLSEGLEGVFEIMGLYKSNSVKRLQKMLNALPDLSRTELADYQVFTEFLIKLAEIHEEFRGESVRDTLNMLISSHRMVVQPDSPKHQIMERLKEDYIVESNNPQLRDDEPVIVYNLTPQYQNVMSAFAEIFEDT